ncbi:MAG: hypothetical protein GY830_05785 [Bacteroidetes bacterium]|nr:hypothetical protein [Bacteroidota bacterium]
MKNSIVILIFCFGCSYADKNNMYNRLFGVNQHNKKSNYKYKKLNYKNPYKYCNHNKIRKDRKNNQSNPDKKNYNDDNMNIYLIYQQGDFYLQRLQISINWYDSIKTLYKKIDKMVKIDANFILYVKYYINDKEKTEQLPRDYSILKDHGITNDVSIYCSHKFSL